MGRDPDKNLETLDLFISVDVVNAIQSAVIVAAADAFFAKQPSRFRMNPANTYCYQALRALEDRSVVHVAEVLKDEHRLRPVTAEIRQKAKLFDHRDALSHPVTVTWRRAEMNDFAREKRQWYDIRAALLWDMQRSVNEALLAAGREPHTTAIPVGEQHASLLHEMLRFSACDAAVVPPIPSLLEYLEKFRDAFMDFLIEHPNGRDSDGAA